MNMHSTAIEKKGFLKRSRSIDELLQSKHGTFMSGAEVATLTILGTNPTIFGLPGGAILPLDEQIARYSNHLNFYLAKHEASAVSAAAGYGATSISPAFALATSGPGIMNAITGIYDATMEFMPTVVISGNVALPWIKNKNMRAFQSADAVGVAAPISKEAFLVESPDDLQKTIIHAFYLASNLPKGAVLVDIPKHDVLTKETSFRYFEPVLSGMPSKESADPQFISQIAKTLSESERPIAIIGRGALVARDELWRLIERHALPFAYTLKGKGILPDDHPYNLGAFGQHGTRYANEAILNSDFALIIGANGDDRAFSDPSGFTKGKVALINPYQTNAKERLRIDFPLEMDSKRALENLLDSPIFHDMQKRKQWHGKISALRSEEKIYNGEIKEGEKTQFTPIDALSALSKRYSPDILSLDVGEHQMHAFKLLGLNLGGYDQSAFNVLTSQDRKDEFSKQVITSGTAGTMATSIPYAVGAKIANPSAQVGVIIGDGGLEMHIDALWLLAKNELDIPIFLLNNQSYGQVDVWLKKYHHGMNSHAKTSAQSARVGSKKLIPDFRGAAMLYDIPYWNIDSLEKFEADLPAILVAKGPRLIELSVTGLGAYPMLPPGAGVDRTIERP